MNYIDRPRGEVWHGVCYIEGNPSLWLGINLGENTMKNIIAKLLVTIKGLAREEGQDLIEYALLVALIAFATTVGVKSVASNINTAFTNIGAVLTANIT